MVIFVEIMCFCYFIYFVLLLAVWLFKVQRLRVVALVVIVERVVFVNHTVDIFIFIFGKCDLINLVEYN